jgi:hypothetical protein
MKTIKASLLLSLMTLFSSLILSGCYTQLAIVDDEQYSVFESSPIIINLPIIVTEPVIPIWGDPALPPVNPAPPAGGVSAPTTHQPSTPPRESGYQRPSQSENAQTTNSSSNSRPSGSTRGGR